jgi:hypothetical protein
VIDHQAERIGERLPLVIRSAPLEGRQAENVFRLASSALRLPPGADPLSAPNCPNYRHNRKQSCQFPKIIADSRFLLCLSVLIW